jgi:sugar-specific transcriptional regulator TrmB
MDEYTPASYQPDEPLYLSRAQREARAADSLTSIDQKLVQMAGAFTPTEISEKTGIPVEEVAQRTLQVLNSVDYFTIEQMRAKQTIMLNQMVTEGVARMEAATDRNVSGIMNATGGNIFRALKVLEDIEKKASLNTASMEAAYARRLLSIVERAFDRYLGKLSERFPDVDAQDIADGFQQAIMEMAQEVDIETKEAWDQGEVERLKNLTVQVDKISPRR